MALVLKDRVKVTTTTTGTGAFAIGGAQFGFQGFSAFANGDTTFYTVVDHATGDWETGVGTYSSTGPTLARTAVLDSSNAGGLVNFGIGPKDLFVVYPAGKAVSTEGNVTLTGPLSVPAGAAGAQVPRRSEVVGISGDESIGGVKTFTSRPKVPAGATLDEVPQAQEIFGKSQSWQAVTRLNGTTYTNTTGKPIVLYMTGVTATAAGFVAITIDGLRVTTNSYAPTGTAAIGCVAVVPPGLTYSVIWGDMSSTTAREYR